MYFTKRASASTNLPRVLPAAPTPVDLPITLANVVVRMFHNDRSVFTAHLRDADTLEQLAA
jgi:hypothetical protein